MNSALFTTAHSDGGCLVLDLSAITAIEYCDGEYLYAYAAHKTFPLALGERPRLMQAWSALKDRQEEQNQPMVMMMGQPEDNGGLVDVFGGGLR